MGWKQDRLARGWKQQLVWLRPDNVAKLESLKQSSGMSYQDIINEMIQLCDLTVNDEETGLERRVLDKLEAYIDARLNSQTDSDREGDAAEEDSRLEEKGDEKKGEGESGGGEAEPDVVEEDRRQLVNAFCDTREGARGKTLAELLNFLRTKTVRAVKKVL
jgi:TATA-binding protein-associated factor Taf7